MKVDFAKFVGILPYASEMYGVYQPLLGWKSKRIKERFSPKRTFLDNPLQDYILSKIRPDVTINFYPHPAEYEYTIQTGSPSQARIEQLPPSIDSEVATYILREIAGRDREDVSIWDEFLNRDRLNEILNETRPAVREKYLRTSGLKEGVINNAFNYHHLLTTLLNHESVVAGYLNYLYENGMYEQLTQFFFPLQSQLDVSNLLEMKKLLDPMETFDPKSELDRVSLSPIGIVHLFRQYFFEFDTFLGPSVQHIWLSPGGTVELIEINTRKTTIERSIETAFETIQKSEKSTTSQDDISDAIKEDNESNTKFGVSVDTSSTFSVGVFTSQINTGTSYEQGNTTKTAREHTHKQMRQQSEKITSEIKRNFKSTFKTVTEVQDTTSKRYVLQNTTDKLLNYELRRKMRQVGVQVQDMGTQLCWQTYVDDPGKELGIANLIHISQPADLQNVQIPERTPDPEPYKGETISHNYTWFFGDERKYGDVHVARFSLNPKYGFIYERHELVITAGDHWGFFARPIEGTSIGADTDFKALELLISTGAGGIKTDERPQFTIQITVYYKPAQAYRDKIRVEDDAKIKNATEEKARLYKERLFASAKDRVKAVSNVEPRKFEDLREEERIVVYRDLIRQLLHDVGFNQPQPRLRHILAELIQSMFDVEKMLYFVAPEWWVPRALPTQHQNPQDVFSPGTNKTEFDNYNVVGWGGVKSNRTDNYYITEDSAPARLGSSLGWLLQLDGDNMRNAFLNAPWVKAVIPIRPHKELAALNWLTHNSVEGTDGLDALYQESTTDEKQRILSTLQAYSWSNDDPLKTRYEGLLPDQITIHDAIRYLAIWVKHKYDVSNSKETDSLDPSLSYLPTDKVYEYGFYPLQGGFVAQTQKSFEVYDQWVEVLPTDQIVAVEVEYDPKTGRLL